MDIDELIAEFEKDPDMKNALDEARQWFLDHKEEIMRDLIVRDFFII